MALFKSLPAWAIILVMAPVKPLPALAPPTDLDFLDLARTVTAASIPAPLPLTQFGPLSATLFPTVIRAEGEESDLVILPFLGLQWWLSPNLALLGGLGSGHFQEQLLLLRRIGLRYLPEALIIGAAIPEFILVQGRIDGLAAYILKWNELQWIYNLDMGIWNISGGLAVLSYSMFPNAEFQVDKVGGKLKASLNTLILAATWKIGPTFHLAGRVIVHPKFISGGAQLSLAI
ncbi:MAG: hypothetical protein IID13_03205 [Candidatus Marinimicrobia bacterium]|nr:hypothetical protein [Candidatus Neomarinimicrobiota bacterium]